MRLHLKLMALLAAFGLLPTLVVGLYGRGALHDLGDDLAARGRAVITDRLTAGMADTIAQAATVLHHRRVALEMTLRAQAAQVERRLALAPPATEAAPGDIAPARLRLAEDADRPAALAQARALADLDPAMADLRAAVEAGVLRQYVITAAGLQVAWGGAPAAGAAPGDPPEDPRLLPWFAHALETGGPVWTAPHRDPVSGQLVLTAGMPVLDASGQVVAVTGLHVSVLAGARALQNQADLPEGTVGMLVMPQVEASGAGLRLLATGTFPAAPGAAWGPPAEGATPPLPEDAPAFRDMVRALAGGGAGTTRLPYGGSPALWAYGALPGAGVAVIYIVPFDRLSAMARGVGLMVREATAGQLATTGGVILGVLAFAVAGAWVGARQVAGPLRALGAAMERVAAGDLTARAPVTSNDEVGEAARRFNEMVPLLEDRLGLRQDLGLAQDVQQALLPSAAPAVAGFDIAGASVYSDETGGDYFDYVPTGTDGRWAVMVGDVSGHGISAALLMTTIRAMLRARLRGASDPQALLQSVNPLLAEDVSAGRFMTLFCLFLEAGRRTVAWSSAGHGGCLLFDPATGALRPLEGEDVPLGVESTWTFAPARRETLAPGQILLLGTDGLLEARDAAGNEFGTNGLRAAVTATLGQVAAPTAETLCRAVLDACAAHRHATVPRDDTTLVVVRVTGNGPDDERDQ